MEFVSSSPLAELDGSIGEEISAILEVGRDLALLLNNKDFADVEFLVGFEKASVYANSGLLSARSAMFRTMFTSSMREGASRKLGLKQKIPIPNTSPVVFREMLHFVYTGRANIDAESLAELYRCADQYLLESLKTLCLKSSAMLLADTNVLDVLDMSMQLKVLPLAEECLRFISQNNLEETVVRSPAWERLSMAAIQTLLRCNYFQVPSELDLYNQVMYWARAQGSRGSSDDEDGFDSTFRFEDDDRMVPLMRELCKDLRLRQIPVLQLATVIAPDDYVDMGQLCDAYLCWADPIVAGKVGGEQVPERRGLGATGTITAHIQVSRERISTMEKGDSYWVALVNAAVPEKNSWRVRCVSWRVKLSCGDGKQLALYFVVENAPSCGVILWNNFRVTTRESVASLASPIDARRMMESTRESRGYGFQRFCTLPLITTSGYTFTLDLEVNGLLWDPEG